MIRLFTENRAFAALLIPVLITGYLFLNYTFPFFDQFAILNFGFFGSYTIDGLWINAIGGGIILLLNASLINYVFNSHNFFNKTTYLPAIIYITWMSFYKEMYVPSGTMLSHTFFILAINQFFFLNQNEDGRRSVFNAALFLGIASCLQPVMLIVFPFIYFSVWILRPFVLRESILIIAGYFTPFLYALVLMLFQKRLFKNDWALKFNNFEDFNVKHIILLSLIFLFFIVTILGLRSQLQKCSIRFRKQIRVLWFLSLVVISMGLINFVIQDISPFSYTFIILSLLSVFSFDKKPLSVIANTIFISALILSIVKFFIQ